jgi:hypothetical protein
MISESRFPHNLLPAAAPVEIFLFHTCIGSVDGMYPMGYS